MSKDTIKPDLAKLIAPLDMNGLQGRVLVAPASGTGKREILFVAGHHTQLERWWSLINRFQRYGTTTAPDLPGFGGMQSFYSIGQSPTIDAYADYLASFIKMRYKKRKLTIVALSFGFAVTTRMLQRNPQIAKQVDIVVSVAGYMHHYDFFLAARSKKLLGIILRFVSVRPLAWAGRYSVFDALPATIKPAVSLDPFRQQLDKKKDRTLWQLNDISTHWRTVAESLRLDNCTQSLAVPVCQLYDDKDPIMDQLKVHQHILVAYRSCSMVAVTYQDLLTRDLPTGLRKALR